MKHYLAPLEGITSYIYRTAYNEIFGGIDKYFTPFITTRQSGKLSSRELSDILPENNKGMTIVPQLLSNNSQDFINTMNKMKEYGYREVNINLGCPSGTVVSKKRGSGFLSETKELDEFLYNIYEKTDIAISIKTRIGKDSPDEFEEILEIYNKYPISELIIHPRIQKDYYKNSPNMDIFKHAYENSKNPLVYNGDIFNKGSYDKLVKEYPNIDAIMLGRGIIANPALVTNIRSTDMVSVEQIKEFHNKVYLGYKQIFSGDNNLLFKMKELWFYMISIFPDAKKQYKSIKKAKNCYDYEIAVSKIFNEIKVDNTIGFIPNK